MAQHYARTHGDECRSKPTMRPVFFFQTCFSLSSAVLCVVHNHMCHIFTWLATLSVLGHTAHRLKYYHWHLTVATNKINNYSITGLYIYYSILFIVILACTSFTYKKTYCKILAMLCHPQVPTAHIYHVHWPRHEATSTTDCHSLCTRVLRWSHIYWTAVSFIIMHPCG